MRMISRIIETSIGASVPLRMILSRVFVLIGPFILLTACSRVSPSPPSPLMWGIRAPHMMPVLRGGRIIHGRNHLDEAILHHDLNPQPAELAAGCLPHVPPGLLVHVPRVGIERRDHA